MQRAQQTMFAIHEARLMLQEGDYPSAAAAARDANGLYRAPLDRARLDSWLPAARRALGANAAEQAVRVGRATPVLDALGDGRAACQWVLGLARRD